MPDMLARLYDLPDSTPFLDRASSAGFTIRHAEPWDRQRLHAFATRCFGELWAVEADRAFNHSPITGYLATRDAEIGGFAVYECTRRGYFGPTGVRDDLRSKGLGAALLLRSLESMREMGYAYAIIGGVGPAQFYERICGAFVIPGSETGIYGPLFELRTPERA